VRRLVAVIDALDLRDATLVVHDWGGPIGFLALLQRRDRFRDAVAFNTALFHGPVPLEIRACRWPVLGPLLVQGLNGFVRAGQIRAIADRARMRDGVGDGYLWPWRDGRAAVQQFVDDIPLERDHPTRALIDQLDAATATLSDLPVTLVWGMRDFCFTPAFLDGMTQRLPHAAVHRLDDAAHYVVEDAHERILPILRAGPLAT
jgi:haloalkane dehalogenase